ncbi:MAG: thiamine-monophosphate kinase [Chitinophagaceae bacterium]|nr:thiamine-monophosphate kinase [Chitinophagaceae bacterium]
MTPVAANTKEAELVRSIASNFTRHPLQVNGLMEADAEIIRQPHNANEYLVLKTDGIHEEIKHQLYTDSYLVGWMAVTAPVSDIAAVGATPTGILLSMILPRQHQTGRLTEGINDACNQYGIHVLGGDTSFDNFFSVSATVIGHARHNNVMLRRGMQVGDCLYTTSHLGTGNAYAYSRFFDRSLQITFQPEARLKESQLVAQYATSCTDTSDGLFPALAAMWEVNRMGCSIDIPLQKLLSQESLFVHRNAKLPDWMLLAGPHGEYELLFTIPAGKQQEFERDAKQEGLSPLYIGRIISDEKIQFITGTAGIQCHPAFIADMFHEANEDIPQYFELLKQQHNTWSRKM